MSKLLPACLAAACALLSGCATNVPPVTPEMASMSKQPMAVLERGRQYYGGSCSACHSPYPVTDYTPPKWREIIADMGERARLSPADSDAVLSYVLAARIAPPPQPH